MSPRDTAAPCICRVPLAEVADQVGTVADHVRGRAEHAGYVVRADWAGRPSLAVADAAVLVVSLRAAAEGAQRDRR